MTPIDNNQQGLSWTLALVGVCGAVAFVISQCLRCRLDRIVRECLNPFRSPLQCEKDFYLTSNITVKPTKLIHEIKWEGIRGFREVDEQGDCFYLCYAVCLLEGLQQKKELLKGSFIPFIKSLKLDPDLGDRVIRIAERATLSSKEELERLFTENYSVQKLVEFLKEVTAQAIEESPKCVQDLILREYAEEMEASEEFDVIQLGKTVRNKGLIDDRIMPLLFEKMKFSLGIVYGEDIVSLCKEEPSGFVILKDYHYRVFYREKK